MVPRMQRNGAVRHVGDRTPCPVAPSREESSNEARGLRAAGCDKGLGSAACALFTPSSALSVALGLAS